MQWVDGDQLPEVRELLQLKMGRVKVCESSVQVQGGLGSAERWGQG